MKSNIPSPKIKKQKSKNQSLLKKPKNSLINNRILYNTTTTNITYVHILQKYVTIN